MPLLPFHTKNRIEAGCDEAGRGCLAGPVFAAAVILPKRFSHSLLNDSKKLSEKDRDKLRIVIEKKALAWAVAAVSEKEIDEINILKASFVGMHRAIDQLRKKPEHLLIDGNRFIPYPKVNHTCIIKGDGIYQSIAAASILAKTHRDAYMKKLAIDFPLYNWAQNKGYPTATHRKALKEFGISEHHRVTFNLFGVPKDSKKLIKKK